MFEDLEKLIRSPKKKISDRGSPWSNNVDDFDYFSDEGRFSSGRRKSVLYIDIDWYNTEVVVADRHLRRAAEERLLSDEEILDGIDDPGC